jgi:RNA polymerase sigma-70 factor (ECF subfamily)
MPTQDVQRFERAIVPHLDDAYTLARYLLRDEHDAQDVVQEAALRALRYFDGYNGDDSRVWLLAIVRNCANDWHRRHRIERQSVDIADDAAQGIHGSSQTDEAAIRESDREQVYRALAALPEEFREVIVLREIQDLSYKEIGEIIGAPIGTVMSRLARARKRLAGALGADMRSAR